MDTSTLKGPEVIITERERIELVKNLEAVMGQNAAATLMEYLPANGWRDIATVTDLDNLRLAMKADMADLRTDLELKIAGLDTKIAGLDGKIAGLDGKIAGLDGKIEGEMGKLATKLSVMFVSALVAFGGLLVAAAAIFKP